MENAAMAAYLKDVESNNVDLTAEKMMREKLTKTEKIEPPENPNQMPSAAPETIPRYHKNRRDRDHSPHKDYCDPYDQAKRNHQQAKFASQGFSTTSSSCENRAQGKGNKTPREKRKGKRTHEEERSNKTNPQKLWYEARTPEGHTYYWHIETNQSVWEEPPEGYMTIAEQEAEAKEEAIQAEFFRQIEKEGAKEKAEMLEEQRANAEREKLRELRKRKVERRKTEDKEESRSNKVDENPNEIGESDEEAKTDEQIPYRRDYSVPEKPEPYGPWQTVQIIPKKPIDLQLPKKKESPIVPSLHNTEPPKRIFTEKIVTQLSNGDSDDEKIPTTFKKRKLGVKNVRKRFDND